MTVALKLYRLLLFSILYKKTNRPKSLLCIKKSYYNFLSEYFHGISNHTEFCSTVVVCECISLIRLKKIACPNIAFHQFVCERTCAFELQLLATTFYRNEI